MDETPEPITPEQIVAHWQRFAMVQAIPAPLLEDSLRVDAHLDVVFGDMLVRMERMVLTDQRAKDEYQASLHFPASPWQHWKHKHRTARWLAWFVRRRPVQMHEHVATVQVERWQTYPDARLPRETFGRPVVFERITGPLWRDHP